MSKVEVYYNLDESSQLEVFTRYVYNAFEDGHNAVLFKTSYRDFLIIKALDPSEENVYLLVETSAMRNRIKNSFDSIKPIVDHIMLSTETIYSIKGLDYTIDY